MLSCCARSIHTSTNTSTTHLGPTTFSTNSSQIVQGVAESPFFRTRATILLTVFGALIFELTKVTFPEIPGQLSVHDLVQQLWDAMDMSPVDADLLLVSQDLSGFFTSIPTHRSKQASDVLLLRYVHQHGFYQSQRWSVFQIKSDTRRRIFKGKWCKQTKVPRSVHAEDIHILLEFVLDNSHFKVNGFLFRQLRGVAMGSPAAPPLCNLVATVEDYFWHHTMRALRVNIHRFGIVWHQRYVDNRFILIQHPLPVSPYVQQFMSLEFYGPPVLLETQHDDKVLGYRCNATLRDITPQLPEHSSQLKSLRSANDTIYSTSSWLSRCCSFVEALVLDICRIKLFMLCARSMRTRDLKLISCRI